MMVTALFLGGPRSGSVAEVEDGLDVIKYAHVPAPSVLHPPMPSLMPNMKASLSLNHVDYFVVAFFICPNTKQTYKVYSTNYNLGMSGLVPLMFAEFSRLWSVLTPKQEQELYDDPY